MKEREYLVLIQAPPPAPIRVALATAADGSSFFPAFTDRAALLRFDPTGGETASAPLSALMEMARQSGLSVVVDPGSPCERHIPATTN
jgi:hypothetical protein